MVFLSCHIRVQSESTQETFDDLQRHVLNVFKMSSAQQYFLLKTSRKMSCRRLGKWKIVSYAEDVLKTYSRCLGDKQYLYWGYLYLTNLKGCSQIENLVVKINPAFLGEGVFFCDVQSSRRKSSSFNKTTDLQLFPVSLLSINNLIPIQTLISSNSFIRVRMAIISIAVLILFQ